MLERFDARKLCVCVAEYRCSSARYACLRLRLRVCDSSTKAPRLGGGHPSSPVSDLIEGIGIVPKLTSSLCRDDLALDRRTLDGAE